MANELREYHIMQYSMYGTRNCNYEHLIKIRKTVDILTTHSEEKSVRECNRKFEQMAGGTDATMRIGETMKENAWLKVEYDWKLQRNIIRNVLKICYKRNS